MNRDNCQDREGKNHFGEFGWYDGYSNSTVNCRLSLKTRGSACQDADGCSQECMKCLKTSNFISDTIRNMHEGAKQHKKEETEDKAIAVARREEEKKKLEEKKQDGKAEDKGAPTLEQKPDGASSTEQKETPKT